MPCRDENLKHFGAMRRTSFGAVFGKRSFLGTMRERRALYAGRCFLATTTGKLALLLRRVLRSDHKASRALAITLWPSIGVTAAGYR
jgi:hypothetical protein